MSQSKLEIKLMLSGAAQVQGQLRSFTASVNSGFSQVKNSILGVTGSLAALTGVAGGFAGFAKLTRQGVEFNSTLEDSRLGIAAVQKALNPKAFKDFNEALELSASVVDKMKEKATKSPASFKQLVEGFQAISGPATQANIALKDQIDLTVLLSQSLAGMGIPTHQLIQESRALITGAIDKNALAARILGITRQQIEAATKEGKLYEFLSGKLDAFAEAGELAAGTLTVAWSNFGDAMDQVTGKGFTGSFEALKKGFLSLTETINKPFVATGLSAFGDITGALISSFFNATERITEISMSWVGVAREAWVEGRFAEFLGLTIEAGTELGIIGMKKAWAGLVDWLSTSGLQGIGKAFLNVSMGFGVKVATGLVDLFEEPIKFLTAGLTKVASETRLAFQKVMNFLKQEFTIWINTAIGSFETLLNAIPNVSASLPKVTFDETNPDAAMTWAEAWKIAEESVGESSQAMREYLVGSMNISKDFLGATSEMSDAAASQTDALRRLGAELDAFRKRSAGASGGTGIDLGSFGRGMSNLGGVDLVKAETEAKKRLLELEQKRHAIMGDFRLTEAQKYQEVQELLQQERDVLQEIIALLNKRAALADDPAAAEGIRGRADDFEKKLSKNSQERQKQGADPTSLRDQLELNLVAVQNRIGEVAQQIARGFSSVIGSAVDGIANSIHGLLNLTMSWGEALRNIGVSVFNGIIQSISRMLAEFIVSHIIMRGVMSTTSAFSDMLKKKGAATTIATETAKTPALVTNAGLASVSSWGLAAAVGIAALVAGMAALSGAFAQGGRPPAGRPALVGEKGPELFVPDRPGTIIPADETQRMMRGFGSTDMARGQGGGAVNVAPSPVNVAVLNNKAELKQFLQSHEGRQIVFSMMDQRKMELGLQS